jgi:hypothetical protein
MAKKSYLNRNHHSVRGDRNRSARLMLGGMALVAVAVLALVWVMLTPIRGDGGKPQLQVSTERLDLGKQILGSTVRASFTVKNAGTGTLTLSAPSRPTVLQGCCPASLVVERTILGPGQSTLVYTDMMMHEGMGGPHLFEIPLTTNDPAQPFKKLLIASDWQPD